MPSRLRLLGAALLFPFALLCAHGARAQSWPTQPIRMIVPFPPGGSVDAVARLLAPHLQQELGQQIIVDNRPGASASIGTGIAAKAAPDGYTFAMVFDTHGVNPSLIPSLPYDTLHDLDHVMLVGTAPMMITVHPGGKYKTFGDILAAAKASPGAVSFGTIGSGSLGHLAVTLMGNQAGFQMTHIPYKGGGPLTQDAVAGHVPVAIGTTVLFAQQVAAKHLIPVAVTSPQRSPQFPAVPTVSEAGVPGFSAVSWWGLVAPAKTPVAITMRMHDTYAKVLQMPVVRERLEQQGMSVRASSAEEFRTFVAGEITRWNKVVKDNKIQAGE
ncbi:MAG TPA: tripartite tricarboxylate transporter substrate binding protein [Burkholderiales bacterium]|jgi:tripartite-type tricarboxylate transporter receptor subunit TctC